MKRYSLFLILVLQFCKAGGGSENKKLKESKIVVKQSIEPPQTVKRNFNISEQSFQALKNKNQELKKRTQKLEDMIKKSEENHIKEIKKIKEQLKESEEKHQMLNDAFEQYLLDHQNNCVKV